MLTNNKEDNYQRFFEDAFAAGCLWSLQNDEGWAQCESDKWSNSVVIPFWSQSEYAEYHCVEDWVGYQVIAIDLDEFLEDWLIGMHEDAILVGVNWDQNLEGEEHEPLDILHVFEQALTK